MTKEQFVHQISEADKSLYRVAKSILKNDDDCADAVQSAILKAFDKLHTLKHEKYFRTWLTRILINECYQMLRDRREQVPYEEYMEGQENTAGYVNGCAAGYSTGYVSGYSAGYGAVPEYSEVFTALMELEDMYRVPFTLHYIEGYSVKEIAKLLDISVSNVKIRLSRARAKLQTRLEGEVV